MTISWNTVIFKFRLMFATGERRIVAGQTLHMVFCGSPLIRGNKRNTEQLLNWIVCPDKILRSSVPKIQRNVKMTVFQEVCIDSELITQPNLTILVSFSSAEDVLSNDVKNMTFLACKVLKICRSAFFGTCSIYYEQCMCGNIFLLRIFQFLSITDHLHK